MKELSTEEVQNHVRTCVHGIENSTDYRTFVQHYLTLAELLHYHPHNTGVFLEQNYYWNDFQGENLNAHWADNQKRKIERNVARYQGTGNLPMEGESLEAIGFLHNVARGNLPKFLNNGHQQDRVDFGGKKGTRHYNASELVVDHYISETSKDKQKPYHNACVALLMQQQLRPGPLVSDIFEMKTRHQSHDFIGVFHKMMASQEKKIRKIITKDHRLQEIFERRPQDYTPQDKDDLARCILQEMQKTDEYQNLKNVYPEIDNKVFTSLTKSIDDAMRLKPPKPMHFSKKLCYVMGGIGLGIAAGTCFMIGAASCLLAAGFAASGGGIPLAIGTAIFGGAWFSLAVGCSMGVKKMTEGLLHDGHFAKDLSTFISEDIKDTLSEKPPNPRLDNPRTTPHERNNPHHRGGNGGSLDMV